MFIKIVEENKGVRLDKFLADSFDFSRSLIAKSIKSGSLTVNGKLVKPSYALEIGDVVEGEIEEKTLLTGPMPLDLEIIYEDEDIMVINKPAGVLTHPALSNDNASVMNGLLFMGKRLSDCQGEDRQGIVHRLDKDTTGCLLIAKNNEVHEKLKEMFENRLVKKYYYAIVKGEYKGPKQIALPLGRSRTNPIKREVNGINAKTAITNIKVLDKNNSFSLLDIDLLTGRTHQIRAHLAHYHYPILADEIYGSTDKIKIGHQALHSYYLSFKHPVSGERMEFRARPDEEFYKALEKTGLVM